MTAIQAHHVFPRELAGRYVREWREVQEILGAQNRWLDIDAEANFAMLASSGEVGESLRQIQKLGDTVLEGAKFSSNVHKGSHPGYTNFIIYQIREIVSDQLTTQYQKFAQISALYVFAEAVAMGKVLSDDGNTLTVSGGEDLFDLLSDAYEIQRLDIGDTDAVLAAIDAFDGRFGGEAGAVSITNTTARGIYVSNLLNNYADVGAVDTDNLPQTLDPFWDGQKFTVSGRKATAAFNEFTTKIIPSVDFQAYVTSLNPTTLLDTSALTTPGRIAQSFVDGATLSAPDASISADISSTMSLAFQAVMDAAPDSLPEGFGNLPAGMRSAMLAGAQSAAGGLVADVAEFTNLGYDVFRAAVVTGDYSAVDDFVAEYGAAAAFGTLAVMAGVTVIGAVAGPTAAAGVAAALALYSGYETVQNLSELVGKIGNDIDGWLDGAVDPGAGGAFFDDTLVPLISAFTAPVISPLVFDLDGDGTELIALEDSTVQFDLDADGFAERAGWVAADDGILAYDRNGNGQIDDALELFGNAAGHAHGFASLAELDTNGDSVIDASDADFADLSIWRDLDSDGRADPGELASLASYGIASIDLTAQPENDTVAGHRILWTSTASLSGGGTMTVDDVFFETDRRISQKRLADAFEFDPVALLLPVLYGHGLVASTWVALSEDASLRAQGGALLTFLEAGDMTGFLPAFEAFMLAWGGAADIDPTSRGPNVDARHLVFLEHLYGTGFVQGSSSDPGAGAGIDLEEQYAGVLARLAGRFIAQAPQASALMGNGSAADHALAMLVPLTAAMSAEDQKAFADPVTLVEDGLAAVAEGRLALADLLLIFQLLHLDLGLDDATAAADLVAAAGIEGDWLRSAALDALTGARTVLASPTGGGTAAAAPEDADTLLLGRGAADTLIGRDGDDLLYSGDGDDRLEGGRGSDIYLLSNGGGHDTILETDTGYLESDTVVFLDLLPAELRATTDDSDGDGIGDLRVGWVIGSVTILGHGRDDVWAMDARIQRFVFADGSEMSIDGLTAALLGTAGDDFFDGGNVIDWYRATPGEGHDTILERGSSMGADRILFQGLLPDDVFTLLTDVNADGAGDLVIGYRQAAGSMTVLGDPTLPVPPAAPDAIEEFAFSDGTILDVAGLLSRSLGSPGDDLHVGGTSANSYRAAPGEGNDRIQDAGGTDRIDFDGLLLADVFALTTDENGDGVVDLSIRYRSSPGSISVLGWGKTGSAATATAHQIETFAFSNGSVLSQQQFTSSALGTPGDDHFVDSAGADWFRAAPGQGNDQLNAANGSAYDRLVMVGLTPANVFTLLEDRNGDGFRDLYIGYRAGSGSFSVLGTSQSIPTSVEQFAFANGAVLTASQLFDQTQGGDGDDRFIGTTAGNDRYRAAPDQGHDTISDPGGSPDYIMFAGLTADGTRITFLDADGDGDLDLRVTYVGHSGSLTVENGFAGITSTAGIERAVFANGENLSLQSWLQRALGSFGNDRVVGTTASDAWYRAAADEGDDAIADPGGTADHLYFDGILASALTVQVGDVTGDGVSDLLIHYAGSSGSMLIEKGGESSGAGRIETYHFADGTTLTHSALLVETDAQFL